MIETPMPSASDGILCSAKKYWAGLEKRLPTSCCSPTKAFRAYFALRQVDAGKRNAQVVIL
jgi:hypothetical protein